MWRRLQLQGDGCSTNEPSARTEPRPHPSLASGSNYLVLRATPFGKDSMRIAVLWILVISALDAGYCVHDGSGLASVELNPLVVWLLDLGGMPALVGAKVAGTSLVVWLIGEMRRLRYGHCCVTVAVICMVQLVVLLSYVPRWM